jgi:hypothetical protein
MAEPVHLHLRATMDLQTLLAMAKQYAVDASPGGLLNPEVPKGGPTELAKGLLGFTPVVGDAISGYDAYQSAKQGNYGEAALNGLGLLPFVPAMGGVLKGKAMGAYLQSIPRTWSEMGIGNNQHPFMDISGKISPTMLPHHQVAYKAMETSDHPIQKFMDYTGDVRLMGADKELNVELLKMPTDEQLAGIVRAAAGKPINVSISGTDGKIIKDISSSNPGEMRRELFKYFGK